MRKSFERIAPPKSVRLRRSEVHACRRCPRLAQYIDQQREREPAHHNAPVTDRGPRDARLLLVGLAPGRLGANRTGRAFVGDSSSDFLFEALHVFGFASTPQAESARLVDTRLTNVVKCLPPQNQPTQAEVRNCMTHLQGEIHEFWTPRARLPRVLISLGGLAHKALWRALPAELTNDESGVRSCPPFAHGGCTVLAPGLVLISCFHPSKLNTQTKRLTQPMLQAVLLEARTRLRLG